MERIITTAAFMFVPSPLNIAHIASTFLPADIYNKLQKVLGKDCLLVSATDAHGIWIKREMNIRGCSYKDLINDFHKKYMALFNKLHITFDSYSITNDPSLESLVTDSIMSLHNQKLLKESSYENYVCNNCLEYLPKRFRIQTEKIKSTGKLDILDKEKLKECCSFCGSSDIRKETNNNWVLDLKAGIDEVLTDVKKLKNVNVKNYLLSILKKEIKEWDITRRNYIGFLLPEEINPDKDMYIYLWYESLIGYALLSNCLQKQDTKFVHFLGKNIIYYHGIVWPFLLRHALHDYKTEIEISARGFLNIEKSDNELIEIDDIISEIGADYARFYLAFKVKDSFNDFNFTVKEAKEIINNILINKIGSFLDRCRKIVYMSGIKEFDDIKINSGIISLVKERIKKIENCLSYQALNSVLQNILGLVKEFNNYISEKKYYCSKDEVSIAQVCYMLSVTTCLLKVYIPEIILTYSIFNKTHLTVDSILNFNDEYHIKVTKFNKEKWEKLIY
jgi:methionyl-tRNA synthetase